MQKPDALEIMEHKLFTLLALIGFSASPVHQQSMNVYYFVSELKTFSEAQLYCRETYTDLATIENMDDLNTLPAGQVTNTGAWIGLMQTGYFYWQWALADRRFYKDGEMEYRNWAAFEPNNGMFQDCAIMTYQGQFQSINCLNLYSFICYDANSIGQQYVYISFLYTWSEAQRYCRKYYTDLVSVRNLDENNRIKELIPLLESAYIGLSRDDFAWSDGSRSPFRNWDWLQPDIFGECVALTENKSWKTESCGNPRPFFCHRSVHSMRQILRLEVKSGLNVNDLNMQKAILAEIQQRLQKLGVGRITKLEWREAADGTVFQKKEH
ncbi:hypothetical protein QQF64_031139 [Cirrhinus molitorella]|uniref:C-type lectin domain-containing protein n=1 Tax=Cirrhinus molitorella TaxID=172907 RepID=A0ABR3N5L9_9TELE